MMNRNIFKAHLKELLKQLSNKKNQTIKEKKARLLISIQTQVEMCNLLNRMFDKDYSNEKIFFSEVQAFVLLDEFKQAINLVKEELKRVNSVCSITTEEHV